MKNQLKIVLISIPRYSLVTPPAGISVIAGVLVKNNFNFSVLDINKQLYDMLCDKIEIWLELDEYFQTKAKKPLSENAKNIFNLCISLAVKEIKELQPEWVGVSLFSYNSIIAGKAFCVALKKELPACKIVVGGSAAGQYGLEFKEKGICDFYIVGEGEKAIIELLSGNVDYPGICNSAPIQIDKLDELPLPDYSQFKTQNYLWAKSMSITGSRGCVRSCTFCDVGSIWRNYRYRSAESIFNEITELNRLYDTKLFIFTDSLINGSLKNFWELCEKMSALNRNSKKKIEKAGHFIIRDKQFMPEEKFELMASAGVKLLSIGVETGSDRLRTEMNKKFTNADLDYHMKLFSKYGIKVSLLFVIGYPTETASDFEQTLDLIERYKFYAQDGTIFDINLGRTMLLVEGSPVFEMLSELKIDRKSDWDWSSSLNPELDYTLRVRRWNRAQELVKKLNIKIRWESEAINTLTSQKKEYEAIKST